MKKIENNYAFIDSNNLHLAIKGCDWDNETLYTYLQKTGYIIIFNYLEKKLGKLPKIKRGVAYKTSS